MEVDVVERGPGSRCSVKGSGESALDVERGDVDTLGTANADCSARSGV